MVGGEALGRHGDQSLALPLRRPLGLLNDIPRQRRRLTLGLVLRPAEYLVSRGVLAHPTDPLERLPLLAQHRVERLFLLGHGRFLLSDVFQFGHHRLFLVGELLGPALHRPLALFGPALLVFEIIPPPLRITLRLLPHSQSVFLASQNGGRLGGLRVPPRIGNQLVRFAPGRCLDAGRRPMLLSNVELDADDSGHQANERSPE